MMYLGADHGGFHLKEKIKQWLSEWGYEYEDVGNSKYDPFDDYPEFAFRVAEKVKNQKSKVKNTSQNSKVSWKDEAKGILACRSAAGMVIAANKVSGVRAVAVFDEESAMHSRTHNDANVLALSGDWLSEDEAKKVLKIWLETEFSGDERHVRRLRMIENYSRK